MRIACLADTHCTVPEIESCSLFPRQLAALNQAAAETLYKRMRNEIQLAYSTCLEWLRENRPWNLLVHLGDVTGGYQEQGCFHPSARKIAENVKKDLQGLAPKIRFVFGNHDLGYSHPGSLPGSGINTDSIAFCKEILGDLFWKEEGEVLSIGICSPIAEYAGFDSKIIQMKKDQAEFLGDTLSSHKGTWVFYTHDPFSPKHFAKEIKGHTGQLQKMIAGDIHDPRKGKFLKGKSLISAMLTLKWTAYQCLQKCSFCPSTAPLWWQGYGFLILSKNEKDIKAQEIILNPPPESQSIPTSSLIRCAWWMIRKRKKQCP